ncbi:hypothetical protein OOT46_22285 [Aquabacterium sp. A7-Y]|uniref:HipA family kinase n=1 Tax=Aquabacterium sp. A7-Y TaxID=1349605 RepID=UPI00223D2340|nr:HipA family kinase [Aquabacterium sp. A7-Y]MCW7540557.1 hypothetical protein [Aquabacterium sp. A7-Y]
MPEAAPRILQIVEVLGPSEQGKSIPFKCRAEDGALYYVKGQQTNRASLWCEWISAHLAVALGLPIPPFSLVQVDEALRQELPREWQHIGCTPAFGSRHRSSTAWFEASLVQQVPLPLQQDVLAFDWWIRNMDRLTGNTNLLWDADQKQLVMIDHNLAFDPYFDVAMFREHHVFAAQWPVLCGDLVLQDELLRRMSDALPRARWACDNAPAEWQWANAEMDVPADFDLDKVLALLARGATPELWRTV